MFKNKGCLKIENKLHEFKILNLVQEFLEVYEGNDWLILKKYILRYSHPDIRKYFTTRHKLTKLHTLNDFEKNLINVCSSLYEKKLILKEDDTHNDTKIKGKKK